MYVLSYIKLVLRIFVGRLAVAQASKRNLEAVQEIHQADLVVSSFITILNVTNQFGKKLEAVNTNLRKVMFYVTYQLLF